LTDDGHAEGVATSLQSNNFTRVYEQTGMYIDLSKLSGKVPPQHEIKAIRSPSEFTQWNDSVERIFNKRKNPELYHKLLNEENFAFFSCLDGQQVVATTMLFINGKTAGVHFVGTLKESRNKGIGASITRTAFEFAKSKGAKIGVLQASPLGKEMYKKIGFRECSCITHWEYFPQRFPCHRGKFECNLL
jgi:predicted N-acetyltransferase YhbS